ncbi:muts domain V-domain-containing protein [Bombardia bombarda]|uniref:DNA mismatch repair protein MSH3 n=1 Tax=Bombardia bombarda TaxID=252184 RepID=A0AA39X0W9_9PEZI|nr:muts domain V-domain-containing protein [Bombardia bombarda]
MDSPHYLSAPADNNFLPILHNPNPNLSGRFTLPERVPLSYLQGDPDQSSGTNVKSDITRTDVNHSSLEDRALPYRSNHYMHQNNDADMSVGDYDDDSDEDELSSTAAGTPRTPEFRTIHNKRLRHTDSEQRSSHSSDLQQARYHDQGYLSSHSTSYRDEDGSADSDTDTEMTGHETETPARGDYTSSIMYKSGTEAQDDIICAITESRSAEVIGLAILNVRQMKAELVRLLSPERFTYQYLLDYLSRLPRAEKPTRYVVLETVYKSDSKSLLVPALQHAFALPVDAFPRKHWSQGKGLKYADSYALHGNIEAVKSFLSSEFYVACAYAAATKYVLTALRGGGTVLPQNSLQIRTSQGTDMMHIDRATTSSLELVETIRPTLSKAATLFGILNSTLTPQGRRLLRTTLLQPSTSEQNITERYDAVAELSSNEDMFSQFRTHLKGLLRIDIDRIVLWYLKVVKNLHTSIETEEFSGPIGRKIKEAFGNENMREVNDLVEKPWKMAQHIVRHLLTCETIESGQSRTSFNHLRHDLEDYVKGLNDVFEDKLGAHADLCFTSQRGYELGFQYSDVSRDLQSSRVVEQAIPGRCPDFAQHFIAGIPIQCHRREKNRFFCQTSELQRRAKQVQAQVDLVTMQNDKAVTALRSSLRRYAHTLFEMSEQIAWLDMLCSFTHLSTAQNYVRPIISDKLVLKTSRNPVMEARKVYADFTANDVYSGNETSRFQIITGGNMSGKSTFIKGVGLIQILAQMGCFVPAQHATVPICDQLFARMSTEDKPESNLGTFGVEMREMDYILRQATDKSLILIDELGRGTSPQEGLAVALAMSERLIKKNSRVFFATHFTTIARTLNKSRKRNILNVHFEGQSCATANNTHQISLPHKLSAGPVESEDYGLDLARRFFSERLLGNAEKITQFLRMQQAKKVTGPSTVTRKKNRLLMAVPTVLKDAKDSSMDGPALKSYLERLQIEFTVRMGPEEETEEREGTGEAEHVTGSGTPIPELEEPDEAEVEELDRRWEGEEARAMEANLPRPAGKRSVTTVDAAPGPVSSSDDGSSKRLRVNRARALQAQKMT